MTKPGDTGLTRLFRAVGYSASGLRAAWQHESAFRQECLLVAVLVPAAFWVGERPFDIALLIAAAVQTLAFELINSAVEAVVDRIGHEHHELAGRAKDIASAAVAISLVLLAVVWLGYVWDRFFT